MGLTRVGAIVDVGEWGVGAGRSPGSTNGASDRDGVRSCVCKYYTKKYLKYDVNGEKCHDNKKNKQMKQAKMSRKKYHQPQK